MTVCYLGGRTPEKWEKEIIDRYFIGNHYNIQSLKICFIFE